MSWRVLQDRVAGVDRKQPGCWGYAFGQIGSFTAVASRSDYVRFVPPRNIEIDRIMFKVITADTVDATEVSAGIYIADPAQGVQALKRLATTGIVANQVGPTAGATPRTLTLGTPFTLSGGVEYYAGFSVGALTTSLIVQGVTVVTAALNVFFGTDAGRVFSANQAASHPIPDPATVAQSGAINEPLLFLRERGT